jgi:Tol biopolymer transport system component
MTTDDRFGPTLSRWLNEEAEHRVPSHLAEVLVHTAATRQRPWWSSLERLLPMTTTTLGGRVAAPRPMLIFALAALLLVAVAGIAILVGARESTPAPFGLAPNGRIYVTDATTIRSFAADGSDRRDVFDAGASEIYGLSVSPDGTHLAFAVGPDGATTLKVLDIATGIATTVPGPPDLAGEPISWSPDGKTLVFAGGSGGPGGTWRVYTASADGSGALATPGGEARNAAIGPDRDVWQPQMSPDGHWISFLSRPAGSDEADPNGTIWLMRPDGSDLHEVAGYAQTPGPMWAPDRFVQRLLYISSAGPTVLDLATGTSAFVGRGFWARWSPDGSQIAYWHDGAAVVRTADALSGRSDEIRPFPGFTGYCQDHPDLTGKTVCSPIAWSPDGTLVYGADIVEHSLLVARADGSGTPVVLPLDNATGLNINVAWQPLRP